MVTEQLERDDVQDTLQAIDGLGHANRLAALGDALVVLVADDDRLGLARGDLRKGRLHLGVERILRHDDDHGHVLVDQGQGTVLELAGEDTLGVHVRDFLDLECTLQTRCIPESRVVSVSDFIYPSLRNFSVGSRTHW